MGTGQVNCDLLSLGMRSVDDVKVHIGSGCSLHGRPLTRTELRRLGGCSCDLVFFLVGFNVYMGSGCSLHGRPLMRNDVPKLSFACVRLVVFGFRAHAALLRYIHSSARRRWYFAEELLRCRVKLQRWNIHCCEFCACETRKMLENGSCLVQYEVLSPHSGCVLLG